MLAFLKKIPWWVYIGVFVGMLFLWQAISGFSYSNKLWNMVRNQIVSDQTQIIEELEKDNLANQQEKAGLYSQINNLKQQRVDLQREKDVLSGRIQELQNALQSVSVPNNTVDLVDLLHKFGLKSATPRKSK